MKANAPEKLYLLPNGLISFCRTSDEDVEYTRTDALIEKAKMFFKEQTEWVDIVGDYHWDEDFFKEFEKAMKL